MARIPVATRCCNVMVRPLNQKPNRLRRLDGTWSSSSRASSLFAFFKEGADVVLGYAGDTVTLDGAACEAAGCETAGAAATTGAGWTAAGPGGGAAGATCSASTALSMLGALPALEARTGRQARAATTARPISSLVIFFMSSVISCRAPLRSSSTLLAEATMWAQL